MEQSGAASRGGNIPGELPDTSRGGFLRFSTNFYIFVVVATVDINVVVVTFVLKSLSFLDRR